MLHPNHHTNSEADTVNVRSITYRLRYHAMRLTATCQCLEFQVLLDYLNIKDTLHDKNITDQLSD